MKKLMEEKEMTGLSREEVEQRIKDGKINKDVTSHTKSIKSIICSNFFTIFNLMNLLLAIAVLCVGSYKNMLFLGLVIINTAISTIQEIHSKRIIDKLSLISSTKVNVLRDGKETEIGIEEIVLEDLLLLESGKQVVCDCVLLEGKVEVNESFITGETDAIVKKAGDTILSGSFIVNGKCKARVEHVGKENYTAKISLEASSIKKVKSEIMNSLNKIIKTVSIVIVPVGILLFMNQLSLPGNTLKYAVVNTVAAIIGMIPEGLVLLTSTVLAVSVIRLSKSKVLVQELYCIETLARVDTLCLDKTGTITEGKMEVKEIVPVKKSKDEIEKVLGLLGEYSQDNNSTIEAIREKYRQKEETKVKAEVCFSSDKKWSGITFEKEGTYLLGAPEVVLQEQFAKYKEEIEEKVKEYRVVAVASSKESLEKEELPREVTLLGLLLISDRIRKRAKETLNYFKEQGVEIKIISGDNPVTVSKIAKQAGVEGYENYVDCSTLQSEEEIEEAVLKYTIFGRVTPIQKKEIIAALKKKGRTVAMTGDGVNDVIALKEADCSIAIASGTDAARSVSQLVLLDSDFKSMPKIVSEGRRTINNIERSATLFLSKTVYATILAVLFLFLDMPYPFMPIQLSLIAFVCIGTPSFILALEPNKERVKGSFLGNVISKSIASSLTVVINVGLIAFISMKYQIPNEVYSTICVILTVFTGFLLLLKISKPLNVIRSILFISMIVIFIVASIYLSELFAILLPESYNVLVIVLMILAIYNFGILDILSKKILKKIEEKRKSKREAFQS